jgi:inner membrane protein
MDSISQIALGATVAEVAIGKKAGNKAILWGAVFGTLPDLDVVLNVFFDEVSMLGIHRGFSHSIFFIALFSPLFGWLLNKIHPKIELNRSNWSWMVFWVMLTHVLLDSFTVYGTQIFSPFTNYPVGLNSIFIIDPVYTLPLLFGIFITLFLKNKSTRSKLNKFTLFFSSFYLVLSLIFKLYTMSVIKENLEIQNIKYEKLITMPTPVNIFMYSAIALEGDKMYVGQYSVFDRNKSIEFKELYRNSDLIEKYKDSRAIKKLLWFSRGYYQIWENEGELYFSDLRFGRSDFWLFDEGSYIFNFKLIFNANGDIDTFERGSPSFSERQGLFRMFFKRVFGNNQSLKN